MSDGQQGSMRRWGFIGVGIASMCATVSCSPGATRAEFIDTLPEGLSLRLEESVRTWMDLRGAPGIAVGIVRQGEIVWTRGFGVTDVDDAASTVIPSTLFHVASNAKPFVGAAVRLLDERGDLHLGAPVVDILPYFSSNVQPLEEITIRQLLEHTSGMPDEEDFQWGDHVYEHDGALEEYVRSVAKRTLVASPGERFSYSNIGYSVLGDVISKVSGASFEDFMRGHILEPLGMNDSDFLLGRVPAARRSRPHTHELRALASDTVPYSREHAPSSTLWSSARDMSRWLAANLEAGRSKGRGSLHRVLAGATEETPVQTGWGGYDDWYRGGWFVGSYRGYDIWSHKGRDWGFGSMVAMLPSEGLGVVVLGNAHFAPIAQITEALLDIMLGLEPPRATVSVLYEVGPIADRFGADSALVAYRKHQVDPVSPYRFTPRDLDQIGMSLARQQRLEDALKILYFNAGQYSSHGWAHVHLSEVYVALGDTARALTALNRALELDPADPELVERVRGLRGK